jgi:hypothetical protein
MGHNEIVDNMKMKGWDLDAIRRHTTEFAKNV